MYNPDIDYKKLYIKYKSKYIKLKSGGGFFNKEIEEIYNINTLDNKLEKCNEKPKPEHCNENYRIRINNQKNLINKLKNCSDKKNKVMNIIKDALNEIETLNRQKDELDKEYTRTINLARRKKTGNISRVDKSNLNNIERQIDVIKNEINELKEIIKDIQDNPCIDY